MTNIKTNIPILFFKEEFTNSNNQESEFKIIGNSYNKKTNYFYCEWQNIYGYQDYLNKSSGYTAEVKIRMYYNPTLITILERQGTKIIKATEYKNEYDKDISYRTIGSIDNIKLENKVIEFKIKRHIPRD